MADPTKIDVSKLPASFIADKLKIEQNLLHLTPQRPLLVLVNVVLSSPFIWVALRNHTGVHVVRQMNEPRRIRIVICPSITDST